MAVRGRFAPDSPNLRPMCFAFVTVCRSLPMPAFFNLAALSQPQAQTTPHTSKTAAQQVPPGQARTFAGGASSGAAPFGAGAPMATGAVMRPTALTPMPAPPPVVSTSQTGAMAAAAINGLNRAPRTRDGDRDPAWDEPAVSATPMPDQPSAARGLPGGPAPAPQGGTHPQAVPAYRNGQAASWSLPLI
jgi:hypothetical protein